MVNIESLQFGYRKGISLFDQLDLTLDKGCVYGLFGVNGAGKTTLIRHIAGLLFPQKGKVSVGGRESKNRDVEMMRDLFIIPEEFWLPSLTIEKYIDLHQGFYPLFEKQTALSILKEFEVVPTQRLDQLSYGQKKKFMIAFGIATNCAVLLMDEPTNGLDIPSKSQFRKIMALHINEERCVLISTHQVRDLSSIIDHVIILDSGRIRFKAGTSEIMDSLSFGLLRAGEEADVLYSEDVFGGKAAIIQDSNAESEIDFELLFNGVLRNADQISNAIRRSI